MAHTTQVPSPIYKCVLQAVSEEAYVSAIRRYLIIIIGTISKLCSIRIQI